MYVAATFLYHLAGKSLKDIICLVLGCSIFGALYCSGGRGSVSLGPTGSKDLNPSSRLLEDYRA